MGAKKGLVNRDAEYSERSAGRPGHSFRHEALDQYCCIST